MIKVIGTDSKKVQICTCGNCASVLEYTLADTSKVKSIDYTGGTDYYRYLKCPACGHKINLGNY